MVVELRQLRITADMDSSAYVRGMQDKVAADRAASASGRDVAVTTAAVAKTFTEGGAVQDQARVKISSSVTVLERLSRQYVDGYGTAQRFNSEVIRLAKATDTQAVSVTHLEEVYRGIQRRYGLVADGAELAARGYNELSQAITNVNAKLGAHTVAAEKAAAADRQMIAANQNSPHGQNFNAANAAYQFQDIAVTAAMGMNPLMIGLQQGTQLASVVSSMERPVAGLASAFFSLISPVSLVTIGLTAGAAALIQYFTSGDSKAEKLNEKLGKQSSLIKAVAASWGDAYPALKAYSDQLERTASQAELLKAQQAATELRFRELGETLGQLVRISPEISRSLRDITSPEGTQAAFAYQQAVDDMRKAIEAGKDPTEALSRATSALDVIVEQSGSDALKKYADQIDVLAGKFGLASQQAAEFKMQLPDLNTLQSPFSDGGQILFPEKFIPINAPVPLSRPKIELEGSPDDGVRREIENRRRVQEAELANLGARSPVELERAARAREMANIVQGEAEAARQSRINLAGTRARVEEEHQLSEAQRDRVRSLNESVAGQQFELSLIGKTQGEVVALQTAYQLTSQLREEAARNNVKVDEREIELIQRKASELGRLADLYARAQLQNELQFERDQLFRSETDQQIASRQKSAGLPVDLSSVEADAIRENLRISELREGVRGFFTDFRDGLMQGKGFGEALGGAILNALSSALTKTSNSLIESLVNSLVGVGGGKGSGGLDIGLLFSAGATATRAAANDNVAGGYSGLAVDRAFSLLGSTETGNASQINSFLKQGGVDINAAQTAWCAGFVNSALKQVGVDGSGSLVANSFQNWGTSVNPTQALRGDVLLQTRGLGASDPGGHVGFATGASRLLGGKQQLQMLSGNTSDSVNTAWINSSELQVRRATEAATSLSGLTSASGVTAQGLGQLGQGFNSFGQNLTSFFPAAPSAPGGGGGLGFFGSLQSLFGPDLSKYTGLTGLFADGTESAPGGLAMVGERGRELINLPKGSQVVPNFRTEQMLSAQNASRSSRRDVDGLDVRISFDETGNPIARVEQTARREAKRESALAVQNFSDKVLPGRMKKINANPRKVG